MPRSARHNCIFFSDNTRQVMGSSVTKNLIGILLLIVLAFAIGVTAADSQKTAAIIIFAVAGLIGIVAMGKNVWMSLFILIPIGQAMPLFKIPMYFIYVIPVFLYWCILVILGHAKFTWRKLLGADLLVFIFLSYMVTVMYRHPALDYVTSNILNIKTDNLSRHFEYPLCLFVLIFYIALSCIPMEYSKIKKILKWGIIIKLSLLLLVGYMGLGQESNEASMLSSTNQGARVRFGSFVTFAANLAVFTYSSASISQLLTSPVKMACLLLSTLLTVISGYRSALARIAYVILIITIIKREYLGIVIATFVALFTLTFINDPAILNRLPYTAQRTLALFPWMNVRSTIQTEAQGSSEHRTVLWQWALDPRTGKIKNYIWGDGCVQDTATKSRDSRAMARKDLEVSHEDLVRWNEWHSGFIAVLKELGIVGLSLTIIVIFYSFLTTCRIASALRNTSLLKYFLVYTYSFLHIPLTFFILPYSTRNTLLNLANFAILKLFNDIAIEKKLVSQHTGKKKYIPLLIQNSET